MKVVWLLGLGGPWWCQVCRDTDCLCHRSYGPISLFSSLLQLAIRRPLWPDFPCSSALGPLEGYLAGIILCCSAFQAHSRAPLAGVLLCRLVQALKRAAWVGSYSVVQCCQVLDGQASLLFSYRCWGVGRERLWWWLHPHAWLSSTALLPWLSGFPPPAFPTTIFSLTSP